MIVGIASDWAQGDFITENFDQVFGPIMFAGAMLGILHIISIITTIYFTIKKIQSRKKNIIQQ